MPAAGLQRRILPERRIVPVPNPRGLLLLSGRIHWEEVRDQSGPVWASVSLQTEASCATLDKDKIPPQVVRCPSDIWIETRNGSACVDWTERQRPSDPGGGDERNTLACGTYEFDRCRTLYENCTTWMKFAELETLLGDVDRARGIDELAIKPPLLDMPEIL